MCRCGSVEMGGECGSPFRFGRVCGALDAGCRRKRRRRRRRRWRRRRKRRRRIRRRRRKRESGLTSRVLYRFQFDASPLKSSGCVQKGESDRFANFVDASSELGSGVGENSVKFSESRVVLLFRRYQSFYLVFDQSGFSFKGDLVSKERGRSREGGGLTNRCGILFFQHLSF
jgi:hypothetical protein